MQTECSHAGNTCGIFDRRLSYDSITCGTLKIDQLHGFAFFQITPINTPEPRRRNNSILAGHFSCLQLLLTISYHTKKSSPLNWDGKESQKAGANGLLTLIPKYHVQRWLRFNAADATKMKPPQASTAVSLTVAAWTIKASMSTFLPQTIIVDALDQSVRFKTNILITQTPCLQLTALC